MAGSVERTDTGVVATTVRRPNPFLWLWYAWGGRLPQRYREWVLRDLTTRGWMLRHIVRALVYTATALVVVFAIVLFVVHAQLWIALAAVPLGLIVGVYYSVSWAWESSDAKLTKYDYPAGWATKVRQDAESERNSDVIERYNAQWRHSQ